MSKNPTPLRLRELLLDGFAAEGANAGESVKVIVGGIFTSDQPLFHLYALRIFRALSHMCAVHLPPIDRLLVLIHEDNSADIYINDFDVLANARVTRSVQAGEPLRSPDLSDIDSLAFPQIDVHPTDKMIYICRHEWRFGLYFDLTRAIGEDKWSKSLASMMKELVLRDFLITMEKIISTKSPATYAAFIVTEGKTDWRHLKRAAEALHIHGIEFDETDRDRGDVVLLKACKEMSVVPQAKPVIFLFDRDNPSIVGELESVAAGVPYQRWGNKVFSMLLPVPTHRTSYRHVSIEMYYSDEVLKRTDGEGRRLCFDNELKKEIHPDNTVRRIVMAPDTNREYQKKVIGQDVENIEDVGGQKIGMSKTAFAEHVFRDHSPYNDLNFDEFQRIFDVVAEILREEEMQ